MMVAEHRAELRGELLLDEPMARHTTWRVGGPARRYYRPADREDLALFLSTLADDEPLFWLGLGSNLLVRDGGIDATVIAMQGRVDTIALPAPGIVFAEAGAACAKVARVCARNGLTGSEFLAGIPGLVGGALAMNAGAFGGETWRHVVQVETIDRQGRIRVRGPEDYRIGYRSVRGPEHEWFASATFEFEAGDAAQLQQRIRELLRRRSESQPTGQPSCGSVFTNPPGDFAARLIESAGLKGHCIGGACVSEMHANFIINHGDASAADIESLIADVMDKVEREHGVVLVPECRIVGHAADGGEDA